jgi:hypothetical protein
VTLLSVFGPTATDPVVIGGWYSAGDASSTKTLFIISNTPSSNGQRLYGVRYISLIRILLLNCFDFFFFFGGRNRRLSRFQDTSYTFNPGGEHFGFWTQWPFFQDQQIFQEDALNTFTGAAPHNVR